MGWAPHNLIRLFLGLSILLPRGRLEERVITLVDPIFEVFLVQLEKIKHLGFGGFLWAFVTLQKHMLEMIAYVPSDDLEKI